LKAAEFVELQLPARSPSRRIRKVYEGYPDDK
jgi:hypothetical protein